MQQGGVQIIDGPLCHLSKLAGLQRSGRVADEDEGPIVSARVLPLRVVTGVNNQRVVHHGPIALGHRFEFLDQLGQHTAVVLANLNPDLIIRLRHVA